MTIVAEAYDYVVGVDTHAATHQFAVLEAGTGRVLDQAEFPTSRAGLARAASWIGRRTGGAVAHTLVSAEGTGTYGAQLARLLAQEGYRVVDAPSPKRARGADKNDAIDAVLAAVNVLRRSSDRLADLRGPVGAVPTEHSESRDAMQILLTARERLCGERTRAVNALNALLRTHDLGIDARAKLTRAGIRQVAAWRPRPTRDGLAAATARREAVGLAQRILDLDVEVRVNERDLKCLVAQSAPVLLTQCGIGPVNAAIILTVWSHPGRVRNQAAFARLGGVCPIEIASGRNREHRLNRGGDRQLNRALHSIANTRMRYDERTRGYVARRETQAMSRPRIRRCLKRYIARELHATLTTALDTA